MRADPCSDEEAALALSWMNADASRGHLALLREHGPLEIWRADAAEFYSWGCRREWVAAFCGRRRHFSFDDARARLSRSGVEFVAWGSPRYPGPLATLAYPPIGLYLRGESARWDEVCSMPRVTIVGTRTPTPYGLAAASALSEAFALAGVAVVSGLAYGIDGRAHQATLASDGVTVAVLGCGADVAYPARHRDLMDRVVDKGVVISEMPPGTRPAPWSFPLRNRILAALGDAVIVVQAGRKSGAMITADRALELGREVFAVPGSMLGERHVGTNRLIQQGAAICLSPEETVQDFCEATRMLTVGRHAKHSRAPGSEGSPPVTEELVRSALEAGQCTVDEIADAAGLSLGEAAGALAILELRGSAYRLGPGRFGLGP